MVAVLRHLDGVNVADAINDEIGLITGISRTVSAAGVTNLALTDENKTVLFGNAAAQTPTILQNSAMPKPWDIGARIRIIQTGAGLVTIAAGAGVTIQKQIATLKTLGQWSVVDLTCIAANVWVASGAFSAT